MANTDWFKRTEEKLLFYSQVQSFDEAMKEWKYTGRGRAHMKSNQVCELCGQKGLRYRFKILNELNGNVLHVGSNCIKKFSGIEIRNDGQLVLDPADRKKHLDRKERELRKQHAALQPLRHLYVEDRHRADHRQSILDAVEFYQTYGRWPCDIVRLITRMDDRGIDYDPSCYLVN